MIRNIPAGDGKSLIFFTVKVPGSNLGRHHGVDEDKRRYWNLEGFSCKVINEKWLTHISNKIRRALPHILGNRSFFKIIDDFGPHAFQISFSNIFISVKQCIPFKESHECFYIGKKLH